MLPTQGSPWLWGLGTIIEALAPPAGSHHHHFHARDQPSSNSVELVRSFWFTTVFLIPERGVHAAPSSLFLSFPISWPCLNLLWSPIVHRNHWMANIPSIYHIMGTPYILTFDSEKVLISSLESSEWRENLFILCCGKVEAFLLVQGRWGYMRLIPGVPSWNLGCIFPQIL